MTTILVIVLVLTVARVEHLIASDVWVFTRGSEFREHIQAAIKQDEINQKISARGRRVSERSMKLASVLYDPYERWLLYAKLDGGKFPYLFLGIQSYRLVGRYAKSSGAKRQALRLIRGTWRFYAFVAAVCSISILVTVTWHDRKNIDLYLVVAVLILLCAGCIATAAGGTVATFTMGAFANYHHSWPPPSRDRLAGHELRLAIGTTLLAVLTNFTLVFVIAERLGGYPNIPSVEESTTTILKCAFVALAGFAGQALQDFGKTVQPFGLLANVVVTVVQAAFVAVFLFVIKGNLSKLYEK